MTYHERFMAEALVEARDAFDAGEVPVGAVIACNGSILVREHNRMRQLNDPTAHAEMLAIRETTRLRGEMRLDDCTLYVTLEPCPMCAGAIVNARLKQLVFGAFDAKAGAAGTLYTITGDPRLNHTVETLGGVADGDCAGILQRFFQERRT